MPYSITPTNAQVSEGAGSITFTITRTGATATETVFFSTTTSQGFSNGADYGIDTSYTGVLNRPLTFTSTVQQHTVTVLINNDTAPEPNEVFGVLLDTSSGTVLASTTFTIVNNDPPPTTDTVPNDTGTGATLSAGQTVSGTIDQNDGDGSTTDADYYRVTLIGGHRYTFNANANVSGSDTLDAVAIRL